MQDIRNAEGKGNGHDDLVETIARMPDLHRRTVLIGTIACVHRRVRVPDRRGKAS